MQAKMTYIITGWKTEDKQNMYGQREKKIVIIKQKQCFEIFSYAFLSKNTLNLT